MSTQFENKITLGNALTIGAMLIGGLLAFAQVQATQEYQAEKIRTIEAAFTQETIETRAYKSATDSRMRAVEVNAAGQSSDLRNIQVGINEIKSTLERIAADERP